MSRSVWKRSEACLPNVQRTNAIPHYGNIKSPGYPRDPQRGNQHKSQSFKFRRDRYRKIRHARVQVEEVSRVALFYRPSPERRQTNPLSGKAFGLSTTTDKDIIDESKEHFQASFQYSKDLRDTFWKLREENLIDEYITIMTRDTQRAVLNLSTIHTVEIVHLFGALDTLINGRPTKSNERPPWDFSEFAKFMTWKIQCWNSSMIQACH